MSHLEGRFGNIKFLEFNHTKISKNGEKGVKKNQLAKYLQNSIGV
jgi:hypothetical protein